MTPPEASGDATPGGEDAVEVHAEHETLSLDEGAVRAVVAAVCAGEGVAPESLGVILAGHALVHELNREWLGHDHETDVVSFSLDETALARRALDGEVYVDLDTAAERAPEFSVAMETEALRYVAHGVLHLAGHDDATDAQRTAMRTLETRYLAAAGIPTGD